MKQPEDSRTIDWVDGETGNGGGRMQSLAELLATRAQLEDQAKRRKPRGAYAGAVKIGCDNHAARARTGKSQAEFARLANVSERTLRTWEAGELVSPLTAERIGRALELLQAERERAERAPRRPVRYYDQHTGQSWSGRGLMPAWMRAELRKGRSLADFERPA